jgi:hypothetical protein
MSAASFAAVPVPALLPPPLLAHPIRTTKGISVKFLVFNQILTILQLP